MRPKRIILLVDSDEQRQAETRFMLKTAGFKVLSSVSADSARKTEQFFDLVLGFWPVDAHTLDRLAHRALVRFVLICPTLTGAPGGVFADTVLLRGGYHHGLMLDAIKHGVARKRGPKPHPAATPAETVQVA